MPKTFKDQKPLTPAEVRCAAAEKALGEALVKHFEAVSVVRLGKRTQPTDAKEFGAALRDTLDTCAEGIVGLLLSWMRLQIGDEAMEPEEIAKFFRLLMEQVTQHRIDQLPEHVATIEEIARRSESS